MRRQTGIFRRALPTLAALALAAGWAAAWAVPALATPRSISSRVRLAYEQNGTIPPCRFTSLQLTTAQNAVDAYDLEYFADYIAAIQNALTLRAAGACSKHAGLVGQSAPGRTPPAAPLPATLTSSTSSGAPVPMLLLAILGLVLVGGATAVSLARRGGSAPEWSVRWRHGTAEARYRAADLWDAVLTRVRR